MCMLWEGFPEMHPGFFETQTPADTDWWCSYISLVDTKK